MTVTVTPEELARFGECVEARLGLRIEPERAAAAAESLARRAAEHRLSIASYLEQLGDRRASDPAELGELARELTTGETYFFRHVEQLAAFALVALPARAAARGPIGPLAVLSAGCSSGEEAYTLAMLAHERAPELAARVTVAGFDANAAAIARARAARYTRWSLRATPPTSERRWFQRVGADSVVGPAIRAVVTFAEGNFVGDAPLLTPARWDVIFCRNALMYLTEPQARVALDRLVASLAPGGYLFLGHAESVRDRADLALCSSNGAFYYQRAPSSSSVAAASTPATDWFADIAAAAQRVHTMVDGQGSAPIGPAAGWPRGWIDGATVPGTPAPLAPGEAGVIAALAEIRALLAAERYGDARARLAALPSDGGHARDVALLRAVVLTHAGEGIAAEHACGELIATGPDTAAGGHYLLALCRDGAGDPRGAADHARHAIELDPSFAMARVELGLLARRGGERASAIAELTAAIGLLEREDDARLALYGGGFGRRALIGLCRAELAAVPAPVDGAP